MRRTEAVSYLETEVLFPLLRKSPGDFAGRSRQFTLLQRKAIKVLQALYDQAGHQVDASPCASALIYIFNDPHCATLWQEMASFGFATPHDATIQSTLLSLCYQPPRLLPVKSGTSTALKKTG